MVVAVGGFLILTGNKAQLDPIRQVAALFYVDRLDDCPAWLEANGAVILHGPRDVTTGRNLTARHPDGLVADGFETTDAALLAATSRFVVPYGGLVRGRLAAGETIIINGATGAYGGAAVLLAMGAGRVVTAGRNVAKLEALARRSETCLVTVALSGDVHLDAKALREACGGMEIAFDMMGSGAGPDSTLAALNVPRRGGRQAASNTSSYLLTETDSVTR